MKKKRTNFFICISISILLLIGVLQFATVNTEASLEGEQENYDYSIYDRIDWKWSPTEVISTESTSMSTHSSVYVDDSNNIHLAWADNTDYAGCGTDADVFYKRWNDSTSSWTTAEVISTESTGMSFSPALTVDSEGNIHIAWTDYSDYLGSGGDYADLFYKTWDATSSSWSPTEWITDHTAYSTSAEYSSIVADPSDNILIAWVDNTDYAGADGDNDIFFKYWNTSSSSWSSVEIITLGEQGTARYPSLTCDEYGNRHLAWQDDTNYTNCGTDPDIFYKYWNVSTASWMITEVVSTESTLHSQKPSIDVDINGDIHIAWEDYTDLSSGTDIDVFYKHWNTSSSANLTGTEVLSSTSADFSWDTSLVCDVFGNVHVVWQESDDNIIIGESTTIAYTYWDVSLSSWSSIGALSTESDQSSRGPVITTGSDGVIYVFWEDHTELASCGTDSDIFFKQFTYAPLTPELAFIVPNPTEITSIYLDWNDVEKATYYNVYRSTSYIWSIDQLVPIATVSSSEYSDNVPSAGYYYYVIVAGNSVGNSSHSNCQYIEVTFPDLDAPELSYILPNPTELSSISLSWNEINDATQYYVYRSLTYIWSVEGMTPIDTVITNSYVDSLPAEGIYFYVIVASDGLRNSTHSNCKYIEYEMPTLFEYAIISGVFLGTSVILFFIIKLRRRKQRV